jgi:hypothetical protein
MSQLLEKVEFSFREGRRVAPQFVPEMDTFFRSRDNPMEVHHEYEVGVKLSSRGYALDRNRPLLISNFMRSLHLELYGDLLPDLLAAERHLYNHENNEAALRLRSVIAKIR